MPLRPILLPTSIPISAPCISLLSVSLLSDTDLSLKPFCIISLHFLYFLLQPLQLRTGPFVALTSNAYSVLSYVSLKPHFPLFSLQLLFCVPSPKVTSYGPQLWCFNDESFLHWLLQPLGHINYWYHTSSSSPLICSHDVSFFYLSYYCGPCSLESAGCLPCPPLRICWFSALPPTESSSIFTILAPALPILSQLHCQHIPA